MASVVLERGLARPQKRSGGAVFVVTNILPRPTLTTRWSGRRASVCERLTSIRLHQMPKIYTVMPDKHRWKLDLGLEAFIYGHKASPFPALTQIGRLIDEYSTTVAPSRRVTILFLLYEHLRFVEKNSARPEKLGGTVSPQQKLAVTGLLDFVYDKLKHGLDTDDVHFDAVLLKTFGKAVGEESVQTDQRLSAIEDIELRLKWYDEDFKRAEFKLSFRGGLAYKWPTAGGVEDRFVSHAGQSPTHLYDTIKDGDAVEDSMSLFAMDKRGRIYVSGKGATLHHSSFMAGEDVLCAGTILIHDGQVQWVTGESGHYRPRIAQIVSLLERLRSYQVKLEKVTVFRKNTSKKWPTPPSPSSRWEPCKAIDLLQRRAWPTGHEPQSLQVR